MIIPQVIYCVRDRSNSRTRIGRHAHSETAAIIAREETRTARSAVLATCFYAYAGNDPVSNDDPSGCGFIDCVKALAELTAAQANLARRQAEHAAAGGTECDTMQHDKAIEQAKNRVRNALLKARTCLSAEDFQKMWDALKLLGVDLGVDLGNGIWKWLNNDPRQNWPWIYGPMPGGPPIMPPVPIPVPVPVVP
jgi:hypothetical protein